MVASSTLSALADSAGTSLAASSSTSMLFRSGRDSKGKLRFVERVKCWGLVGSKNHILLSLIHLCLMASGRDRNHNSVLVLSLIEPIIMVRSRFLSQSVLRLWA